MEISNQQIDELSRVLARIVITFYNNEENEKAFQEWVTRCTYS